LYDVEREVAGAVQAAILITACATVCWTFAMRAGDQVSGRPASAMM
jgi:hypothetical protein